MSGDLDPGSTAGALTQTRTLDLTTDEANAPAAPLAPLGSSLGAQGTLSDWTRLALAGGLLLILAVLTLGAFWYVAVYPSRESAIEALLKLVFTPVIGLVGSVVGFYFGSRSASDASGKGG